MFKIGIDFGVFALGPLQMRKDIGGIFIISAIIEIYRLFFLYIGYYFILSTEAGRISTFREDSTKMAPPAPGSHAPGGVPTIIGQGGFGYPPRPFPYCNSWCMMAKVAKSLIILRFFCLN
ncbi:hypothetical protein ACQCVE_12720 [Metabacillus sp. 113a]|uniref:hypothetical protein n=1 Tax=Metabacillus sp. 113a TaxID=3404706 RepID=UPI003CF09ABB